MADPAQLARSLCEKNTAIWGELLVLYLLAFLLLLRFLREVSWPKAQLMKVHACFTFRSYTNIEK